MNWLVPPPTTLKVIRKMINENASGVLVVPVWKSAPYWPILNARDGHSSRKVQFFPKVGNIFGGPKRGKHLCRDNNVKFDMAAFLFESE